MNVNTLVAPPSPLTASALVALGGAAGSVLRYQLGRWITHLAGPANSFPWATLAINISGSLLMGGLLGGFTTFSTFSAELVTMLHRGQAGMALGYAAASLVAGMAAVVIGLIAAQSAG